MIDGSHSTGKFDFHENCSLVHHIPPGVTLDSLPVIVFPKEPGKVTPGKIYEFFAKQTRRATYTIDGIVYRVVHALQMYEVDGSEGDFLDRIMHSSKGKPQTALGDHLPGETLSKLAALRARL